MNKDFGCQLERLDMKGEKGQQDLMALLAILTSTPGADEQLRSLLEYAFDLGVAYCTMDGAPYVKNPFKVTP